MESRIEGNGEEERRFAIMEASRSRDSSKLPWLLSLLETDTESNRRHISRALGHIGGDGAVEILLRLLDREQGLILGDIARSLGRLRVIAAVPRLQSMRSHPVAWVSESARWACEELMNP